MVVAVLVGAGAAVGGILSAPYLQPGSTFSSTTTRGITSQTSTDGVLSAQVTIGPMKPICVAGNAGGVSPYNFSGIDAVITSSSGASVTLGMSWAYDGCNEVGSVQVSLAPGSYTFNLTSCNYMGCSRALPVSFLITAGQTYSLDITVDTGIR